MTGAVHRIGFAYNPTNDAAVELRDRAEGWCGVRGIDHWSAPSGDLEALIRELPTTDVLVVLGGDGTFLRAARAVAEVDVPLLGVNLGKVGFLSKAEANELEPTLAQIADGAYTVDERMSLRGVILAGRADRRTGSSRPSTTSSSPAARGRVVRLDVTIGGSHLATFVADGLVVASPTGSTGYSFSAGGPILDPLSRNLIVTPIAGYLSAIRSIVVAATHTVTARRRRPRGAGQHRRARGPPDRGRRRRGGLGRCPLDPVRRARRRRAVLGPAAAQGRAPAVLTTTNRPGPPARARRHRPRPSSIGCGSSSSPGST